MTNLEKNISHTGFVAIIGRPNVGKSTLLNAILGEKISITSRKPQTTRHKILGIKTEANTQAIYIDTPGIYQAKKPNEKRALNRSILKTAWQSILDVDLIIFVTDHLKLTLDDEAILNKIKLKKVPILFALNKVDLIKNKSEILPFFVSIQEKFWFQELVPFSAKHRTNIEELEKVVTKYLPEKPFIFPDDQITDRNDRFLTSEIVREKLMRFLGEELPYAVEVQIEKFSEEASTKAGASLVHISAVIFVEKPGQKAIVIGKNGAKLKEIGTAARKELEKALDKKVFLELWVKVKDSWADDQRSLKEFGYQ